MTTVLPDAKLYFHDVLWGVPWDDVISERDGESKQLLKVMKKMGHILESCQKWDATPCAMDGLARFERELVSNPSQYGDSLKEFYQELWGDNIEDIDPGRILGRAERRRGALEQRNRLRRWLEHEDLAPWDHELRRRPVKSFPALISDDHTSVRDTLRKYKMGFSYLSYQRASAIVHGSYIDPFMEDWGQGFIPSVIASPDNLEREAAHARRFAHNNCFRLHQLREWIAEFCVAG